MIGRWKESARRRGCKSKEVSSRNKNAPSVISPHTLAVRSSSTRVGIIHEPACQCNLDQPHAEQQPEVFEGLNLCIPGRVKALYDTKGWHSRC